jgi:SAM-dependent methyltransferase
VRTLCRGSDRLFSTTREQFLVVECAGCRLLRLYPRPEHEQLARYYPAGYWYQPEAAAADRLAELWRRLALRDHLRFARRALAAATPGGLVLDVGCGGGLFLRELAPAAHPVLGLDFSLDAARVAWSANGVPAVCATLAQAPLATASCSLITMYHVLEHLYDPAAYLEAARRLLKPGGRLVVQVPNASCWQFLMFGENWNGLDIPRHLLDFRERDLRLLLEHCGFEVLRAKHFSLRDNPAGMATSIAPGLDPMARRVRGVAEGPLLKLWKNGLYFLLLAAALPFTLLEAACGAGATIMLEARPKP